MPTMRAQTPTRTFWWDRARSVDADVHPLRAVIFDADTALADTERSDDAPKAGLIDLVMSLFLAGIWVAVVSTRDRESTHALVRQLIGEGLVETIVSGDDLDGSDEDVELYQLALWELGIKPESALAIEGTARGFRAAMAAGLPTVFVANGYTDGQESAADCRQLHRRWWLLQKRSRAA